MTLLMKVNSTCTGLFYGGNSVIGMLLLDFGPRKKNYLLCWVPLVLRCRIHLNIFVGSSRFLYIIPLNLDVTHCNSITLWFVSLYLLSVLYVPPPGSSVLLSLLVQLVLHSTWIWQQYSGVIFDYMHLMFQQVFSCLSSHCSLQRLVGSRGMVSLVLILVFLVVMNGVLHVDILELIFGPCPFHSPTEVILQYTIFPINMWWLCTCLIELFWGVGHVISLNILHQNHRQSR